MREYLDKNIYYGEIKLWCGARKDKAIGVVVEAKADELFFRKLFVDATVFFPVDGSTNVKNVICEAEKNSITGVVGIIDADFRRFTNEKIESNQIFFTDGHDIEMMTVNSEAWNNIIDFYKSKEKLDTFEKRNGTPLKEYILNIAKPIASVRFLNLIEKLELKFKTLPNKKGKKKQEYNFIDYHKFIETNTLEIDKEKMLKVIENKSEKQGFLTNSTLLKEKIKTIEEENYELIEFCNGHDFMNILSIALKKVIGNKVISGKDLEEQFIIAYRFDDFKKTKLYLSLANWNEENKEFILW